MIQSGPEVISVLAAASSSRIRNSQNSLPCVVEIIMNSESLVAVRSGCRNAATPPEELSGLNSFRPWQLRRPATSEPLRWRRTWRILPAAARTTAMRETAAMSGRT
eukprot:14437249-Alexandrium_andersonii.AAC.1